MADTNPFNKGFGLTDVLTVLKSGVVAIGNLTQTIARGNLNQTGVTNVAAAGSAPALPAQPAGYFTVVNQTNGQTVKVPFFN